MFMKGDSKMKCEVIIDPSCEEKIVIHAHDRSEIIEKIIQLAHTDSTEILGYNEDVITKLCFDDIYYISVIGGKVYATCEKEKYILKERLYSVEDKLPDNFIKINQSCIANIRKTQKFDTSISGTLKIVFKNGDTDYVSRRQLKNVKERLGI